MTRVYSLTNLFLTLTLCFGLTACNQEDFFEKEVLAEPGPATTGSVNGGADGGVDAGVEGGVNGGSDAGVNGGTDGGIPGGVDGGTDGGSTVGGTDGGTPGGTDGGTTVGGTDGGVVGGTDGGSTGIVYEDKTELFQQSASENKKLDILWVIDDSGSMSDEQSALGYNFGAFIDDFILKDADFKMAITTTDVSSSTKKGRMVPNSDVLLTSAKAKENEAQFKQDFKSLVNVGIRGSGNERGLEATEGFIEKHASFLRSDAYLAVVIISDELDSSPKSVETYVNQLKATKSEAGLVKVYSIVDIPSGGRYKQASDSTGGVVMDIRNNFHGVLSDMGDSLINLLDSFALAASPVPGSLKVFINGVETTAYTYDVSTRSIKFHHPNLPAVGSEIKAQYKVEK